MLSLTSAGIHILPLLKQEMIPKSALDDSDVARVEQVLLESNRLESAASAAASLSSGGIRAGLSNSQTCRLRGEIFDLGVRELSSSIQASLLLELEGAGCELGASLYWGGALFGKSGFVTD